MVARIQTKPNFLYVGAAKCGSTWLFNALKKHPEVFLPDSKELFFFDRFYDRGMDWYLNNFVTAPNSTKCIGEISHDYLYEDKAAQRIKSDLGDKVKIIVFIRNPIEKAFSGYLFKVRNGRTTLSFEEDLKAHSAPLDRVNYAKYIKPYIEIFGKENVGIFFFEELQNNPVKLIKKVTSYLDIASDVDLQVEEKVLPASKPRNRILSLTVKNLALFVRRIGLQKVVAAIKKNKYISQFLYIPYGEKDKPQVNSETRKRLVAQLKNEVFELNELVDANVAEMWPEYFAQNQVNK